MAAVAYSRAIREIFIFWSYVMRKFAPFPFLATPTLAPLRGGNVFAASLQFTADEGTYPPESTMGTSQVDRQSIRAATAQNLHPSVAGEQKVHSDQAPDPAALRARAEVTHVTPQAIDAGHSRRLLKIVIDWLSRCSKPRANRVCERGRLGTSAQRRTELSTTHALRLPSQSHTRPSS